MKLKLSIFVIVSVKKFVILNHGPAFSGLKEE